MKKIFRPFIKGTNWIVSGLLTLLGFPGCSVNDPGVAEYGSPFATYTFRGSVSNEAGEAVPDIKIETLAGHDEPGWFPALSNAAGYYAVQLTVFPSEAFKIIASDIDGDRNGVYSSDTVSVSVNDSDYYDRGDGKWDHGSAEKEVNIVLKAKK